METLQVYGVQLAFLLVAGLSLLDLARQRDRHHLQVAALLFSLALVVFVLTNSFAGLRIVAQSASVAAAAQPFLILRLVQQIRPTRSITQWVALGGFITTGLVVVLAPTPRPLWAVALGVFYFFTVNVYAGIVLAHTARTSRGVTRQRAFLVALASLLFAAAILIAGWYIAFSTVAWTPVLAPLALVLFLLTALGYYLGFSPPRLFRRSWQEDELNHYLRTLANYPVNERAAIARAEVTEAAIHVVGALDANIGRYVPAVDRFEIDSAVAASFGVSEGILARMWQTLTPSIADTRREMGSELAAYALCRGAQSLFVVPLPTVKVELHVLLVWLRKRTLFAEDDLHLLTLLAKETASALDYAALYQELEEQKQVLEERVQERTAQLARTNESLQAEIAVRGRIEQALRVSEARFRALLENSFDVVTMFDTQGNILYSTPATTRVLGYALEEYVGRNLFAFVYPEDFPIAEAALARILSLPGGMVSTEFRLLHKDGSWVWIEGVGTNLLEEPSVRAIVGNYRDITDRKRGADLLKETNVQLENWVRELHKHYDESRELNLFGEALQSCFHEDEVIHAVKQNAPHLFPDTFGALGMLNDGRTHLEWVARWGAPTYLGDGTADADDCWALQRGRNHLVPNAAETLLCKHLPFPPPAGYVCIPLSAQDEVMGLFHVASIGDRELPDGKLQLALTVAGQVELTLTNLRLRESLHEQSIRDSLTGLFNRRYMEEALEREVHKALRTEKPIGILMLDLDHFKAFNDSYGHEAGDALLRALGQFVESQIRQEDIACRYGGEEFALILPDAPERIVIERGEALRRGAEALRVVYRGEELPTVTISVGIALYPDDGISGMDALRAADAALYTAKHDGRNRVVLARERG